MTVTAPAVCWDRPAFLVCPAGTPGMKQESRQGTSPPFLTDFVISFSGAGVTGAVEVLITTGAAFRTGTTLPAAGSAARLIAGNANAKSTAEKKAKEVITLAIQNG